jgi:acetyl esterase/lipase
VKTVAIILIFGLAVAAVFLFVPGFRGLLMPMPNTVQSMVRESRNKPPVEGVVHRDLVYRDVRLKEHHLDLYEPLGEFSAGRPPVVVFFHGGSWIHGDKITIRIIDRFLRRMRKRGYFVAAVNYTTWLHKGLEGPLENSRAAIEWLASQAERFGYDPHNLGLYGVSAGGHLALMTGSTMRDEAYSFAFMFGECAPTDLVAMKEGEAFEHSAVFRVFSDDRLRELSPITYVDDDLPPVLLLHGGQDQTVHVRQSKRYAEALRKAGADVELIIYPEGNHAFLNLSDEIWYEQETRGLEYFARHFGG